MKMIKRFGYLLIVLSAFLTLAANADKPNLVLLPIDVSQQDVELESEYGSALQQGLQKRYTVFYGAAVEKELEKEYSKIDCDAETCNQNVAIAFNGELIADSSVKYIEGGYLLKLVIRNVLTSEVIETQSVPCRGCDSFSVIDYLKQMGSGADDSRKTTITRSGSTASVTATNIDQHAILIFDTRPTGANISINGTAAGLSPYQGLNHKVGETIQAKITLTNYRPYEVTLDLQQAITQLEPIILERGQGQVLVASNPFKENATVYVNGLAKGKAPLRLTLLAGQQNIQIKTKSESTKVEKIDIKDRDDRQLVLDFIMSDREKNKEFIDQYTKEIAGLDKKIQQIGDDITRNKTGLENFPELAVNFNPKISALTQQKEKHINQRKGLSIKIKKLKGGDSEQSQSFTSRIEKIIESAKKGHVFTVSAIATCSFTEIYGKYKNDKSVCLRRALDKAKTIAEEKYSPVEMAQEFKLRGDDIHKYYSVEVSVVKKDKDNTWLKIEPELEQFKAKFTGKMLVKPIFNKETLKHLAM